MARFFVTTGISIWDSTCWEPLDGLWAERPEPGMPPGGSIDSLRSIIEHGQSLKKRLHGLSDRECAARALEIVEQDFVIECWKDERNSGALSAELATLRLLMAPERPIRGGDRVTLIAGETNSEAAWLIWAVLTHLAGTGDRRVKEVQIDEPVGPFPLDPVESCEFLDGMDQLWNGTISTANDELHLVLSGGYKAVLIELARRAASGGNPSSPRPYTFYYLFEGGERVVALSSGRPAAPETGARSDVSVVIHGGMPEW